MLAITTSCSEIPGRFEIRPVASGAPRGRSSTSLTSGRARNIAYQRIQGPRRIGVQGRKQKSEIRDMFRKITFSSERSSVFPNEKIKTRLQSLLTENWHPRRPRMTFLFRPPQLAHAFGSHRLSSRCTPSRLHLLPPRP